jgi:hypothetical protein
VTATFRHAHHGFFNRTLTRSIDVMALACGDLVEICQVCSIERESGCAVMP